MEAKDDFHPIVPFQPEPPREHAHTGEWHSDEKNHAYCSAFNEVRGIRKFVTLYSASLMKTNSFIMILETALSHAHGVPKNNFSRAFHYLRYMAFRIT